MTGPRRVLGATEGQVHTLVVLLLITVLGLGGMQQSLRSVQPAAIPPSTPPVTAVADPSTSPPTDTADEAPPSLDEKGDGQPAALSLPAVRPAGPSTDAGADAGADVAPEAEVGDTTVPVTPAPVARVWSTVADGMPTGIAVTEAGRVVVGLDRGQGDAPTRLLLLDGQGDELRVIEVGGSNSLAAVAVDGPTAWVVESGSDPRVFTVDIETGEVVVVAVLPDLPVCVPLVGPEPCEDHLVGAAPAPSDVAVLGDLVLVADRAQGVLFAVDRDSGEVTVWAKGDLLSSLLGDEGPVGLGVGGENLLVVVGGSDDAALLAFEVERGAPTSRRVVAVLAPRDDPRDVVPRPGGFAVSLRATGSLALLDESGGDVGRLSLVEPGARPGAMTVRGGEVLVVDGAGNRVVAAPIS